ncbi:hypothetical protein ACFFIX_10665 [Metabacillus herbersteinensis]|uniref:Spore coat protein n=1 Tax=Metabacillus herbersteinensis TaxID=283816 RepID=A0ABV6GDZ8_9BACI
MGFKKKKSFDDCGCKNDHHDKCSGCACDQLRDVTPGTTVFLTIDGVASGPYTFASFCEDDCCVTLITGAGITPSGAVFIVDCNQIDAVTFSPSP